MLFFFLIHIPLINHAIQIARKPAGSGSASPEGTSGTNSLCEKALSSELRIYFVGLQEWQRGCNAMFCNLLTMVRPEGQLNAKS